MHLVAGRQSNGLHSLPDTHLIRQEQPALALHPAAHALALEWQERLCQGRWHALQPGVNFLLTQALRVSHLRVKGSIR